VSDIVRTRFGYHIVKVEDKRPARGNIKVAHIMVRIKKDATDEERENAEKKINEIYDKLQQGEDFAELAKQYSDDKGSASKGGELPVFSTGRMVASFEDAAFSLKEDGEISKPVLTEFGWHIIKRISLKDLGTYDEEYERIKAKVARDSRSNKSKETMISRIQKEYGFKENLKAKDAFAKVLDDSFFEAKWDVKKAEKLNDFLFGFYAPDGDKKEVTQQDFANYLSTHQMNVRRSSDKMDIRVALNKAYKNFVEEQTLAFEDSRLEKKYPEFKHLMQEYRDGILLFELTDQKVWSKALKDTAGLKEFYEKNKDKYMWGERIDATIYTCANEDIAKQVRKLLKKKKKKGFTNGEIVKQINKDSQLNLKIESGKFEQGENEWVDKAGKKIGFSENFEVKNEDGKVNSIVFVEIHGIVKPEPKKISEARGLITSDYQAYLENEWVKELKNNYKVTVNKEILKMLLK
jgi:peptidyl-prolyl cis-trans isomerase SurA